MNKKRICVFGDSIVSNEGYFGYDNWVTILQKYISKQNESNSVFNLGISGEKTDGLLKRIETEIKARRPNIIIIHIGSNDSGLLKGKAYISKRESEKNIKDIITICKKYSASIIITGLTPCVESKTTPTIWHDDEHFTNKQIKEYNDIIQKTCKKEKLFFIDIFNSFKKRKDLEKLFDKIDGVHPNKKGNEFFAKLIIDFGKSKKIW
ncbi:MAG: SGNH/GDSL hydrolase family protein [Candidatus Pacearchaeota archaeon]|jgi:lysophospholipase L1-like esterase